MKNIAFNKNLWLIGTRDNFLLNLFGIGVDFRSDAHYQYPGLALKLTRGQWSRQFRLTWTGRDWEMAPYVAFDIWDSGKGFRAPVFKSLFRIEFYYRTRRWSFVRGPNWIEIGPIHITR